MTLVRLYLLGFVLYGLLVAGATYHVARQARSGPHTKLLRPVDENQWIEDAYLTSVDQEEIARHFARRRMESGQTITPDDVAAQQHPAPRATLAVLASYARDSRPKSLAAGDKVRLCLDGAAVTAEAVVVEAVTCDATTCIATLPLPELPKPLEDKDVAARLRLVDESKACDSQ